MGSSLKIDKPYKHKEFVVDYQPIAQMACASLPSIDDDRTILTRKRQLLEIEDLELSNLEKRARIDSINIVNKITAEMHIHAERQAAMATVKSFQTLMCSLSTDTSLDNETRLALEDIAKDVFITKRKLIDNTEDDEKTKHWYWKKNDHGKSQACLCRRNKRMS